MRPKLAKRSKHVMSQNLQRVHNVRKSRLTLRRSPLQKTQLQHTEDRSCRPSPNEPPTPKGIANSGQFQFQLSFFIPKRLTFLTVSAHLFQKQTQSPTTFSFRKQNKTQLLFISDTPYISCPAGQNFVWHRTGTPRFHDYADISLVSNVLNGHWETCLWVELVNGECLAPFGNVGTFQWTFHWIQASI